MKMFKPIVGALFVSAMLATSGFAITAQSEARKTDIPHPIKVVSPSDVPPCCADKPIEVAFTLDEQGRPFDIEILHPRNRLLTKSLLAAIEQWRFTPVVKDGVPVKQRCMLPLVVTVEES